MNHSPLTFAVPPEPPSQPLYLHAANITSQSVQILWSKPEDTGGLEIKSYEVMVASQGRPDCQLETAFTYSVTLSDEPLQTVTIPYLKPYFCYEVAVAAINSKGASNFSEPFVFWTSQAGM